MKAVMISIQPKWCSLISSGRKTIEVRKTKPKLKPPFKCYIYETKGLYKSSSGYLFNGRGKVIGEFICKKTEICLAGYNTNTGVKTYHELLDGSCLSANELMEYGKWKPLYGWHISDLVIYDKPKELSEFTKPYGTIIKAFDSRYIQRPPQSWCYVEKGAEDETDKDTVAMETK